MSEQRKKKSLASLIDAYSEAAFEYAQADPTDPAALPCGDLAEASNRAYQDLLVRAMLVEGALTMLVSVCLKSGLTESYAYFAARDALAEMPPHPCAGKWAYAESEHAEEVFGRCDTREEAIAQGALCFDLEPGDSFCVVRLLAPEMPGEAFDVMQFSEEVGDLDDWMTAEPDAWNPSPQDLGALEQLVRQTINQWCHSSGNVPDFGVPGEFERVTYQPHAEEGVAR